MSKIVGVYVGLDYHDDSDDYVLVSPRWRLKTRVAKRYPALMSQPVKLSDELVCDARLTAEVSERSIASQIEFWAQLGRSIEPLLRGDRVVALRRAAKQRPISEAIADVDTEVGRQRVFDYLESQPFPHFQVAQGSPGLLVKIGEDGTETVGRFVNREFLPVEQ